MVTVFRSNVAPNDYMWPVPPLPRPPEPTVRSETFVGMCYVYTEGGNTGDRTDYYSVYRIEFNVLNGVQPPPTIATRLSPGYRPPEDGLPPPRCADVQP
jgi:hypothetical protein